MRSESYAVPIAAAAASSDAGTTQSASIARAQEPHVMRKIRSPAAPSIGFHEPRLLTSGAADWDRSMHDSCIRSRPTSMRPAHRAGNECRRQDTSVVCVAFRRAS
jgi:hypothetical protein